MNTENNRHDIIEAMNHFENRMVGIISWKGRLKQILKTWKNVQAKEGQSFLENEGFPLFQTDKIP